MISDILVVKNWEQSSFSYPPNITWTPTSTDEIAPSDHGNVVESKERSGMRTFGYPCDQTQKRIPESKSCSHDFENAVGALACLAYSRQSSLLPSPLNWSPSSSSCILDQSPVASSPPDHHMAHTLISRLLLVLFELLSAVILYPIAFQLNDSIGVYVGTLVVGAIGLIMSFLAHKARIAVILGILIDVALIVLPAIPNLHTRYSNYDYPMTESMAYSLRMAVTSLAVLCLLLRIYFSIIVIFVEPTFIEKYSLYASPLTNNARSTAIQVDAEAHLLLVQNDATQKKHPLLEKVDMQDTHIAALIVKKVIIAMSFVIAFCFVFQFFYSFLASTIGLMPLAEEKNKTILLTAHMASDYLLCYGFAVLTIGVASLFALFSKPTLTRLLVLSSNLIIFGIISCFGAAFVHGWVYRPAYVEVVTTMYPYNPIRRYGFHFDVAMTSLSFVLAFFTSAYAFIEFYWTRR